MKSWHSLNPKQKLKRFKNVFWIFILVFVFVFIQLDFMIALGLSVIFLISSYLEYKRLKKEADQFVE